MEAIVAIGVALIGALATIYAARISRGNRRDDMVVDGKGASNGRSSERGQMPEGEDLKESKTTPAELPTVASRSELPGPEPDSATAYGKRPMVLVVDDRAIEMSWLTASLMSNGFEVKVVTTEEAAKVALMQMAEGKVSYAFAIFDIMIPVKDMMELVSLETSFYEDSRDTGLRLCWFARKVLRLSEGSLPIACISARNDPMLLESLAELNIPLFPRTPSGPGASIEDFVAARIAACENDGLPKGARDD